MVTGKIETLFRDRQQQEAIFPTTKTKAVSDDNGIGLNALLDDMNTRVEALEAAVVMLCMPDINEV